MNRIHINLAVAFTLVMLQLIAQTPVYDSMYHINGVSSVHLIIKQNGETTLNSLERYNREGYKTALHYHTPKGKYNVDIIDTFILRSTDYYTSIDRGDRRSYDSTNLITKHGKVDTTVRSFFKNGRVMIRYVSTYSKDYERVHRYFFEKPYSEAIHVETYKFDLQGRMTEKVYIDSLIKEGKRTERVKYHYYYKYNSDFHIQTVLKIKDDSSRNSFTTYTATDGAFDSIVMYNDNGSVDYYFSQYRDVSGRDSVSTTWDGNHTLTNRNVTTYSAGYKRIQHADGKGFVFKTHEYFFNEKGLVVKEVETDHKFDDIRTLAYAYTYY